MWSVLVWSLFASLPVATIIRSTAEYDNAELTAQNAGSAATAAGEDEGIDYTLFNDIKVPKMKDISGEDFNETIKDGYW